MRKCPVRWPSRGNSKVNKRHLNTPGNFVLSIVSQWDKYEEELQFTQHRAATHSALPVRTWLRQTVLGGR